MNMKTAEGAKVRGERQFNLYSSAFPRDLGGLSVVSRVSRIR